MDNKELADTILEIKERIGKKPTPKDLSQKAFQEDYQQGIIKPVPFDLNLKENKHGIPNKVEDLKTITEGVTSIFTAGGHTWTFVDGLLMNVTDVSTSPSVSPSVSPS